MQARAEFIPLKGRDGIKTEHGDEGCGFFSYTVNRFIWSRTEELGLFSKSEVLSLALLRATVFCVLQPDGSMNLVVSLREWES